MSEHAITIDTPLASHTPTDDFAARAYCTDECGWAGAWHHAEDYPDGITDFTGANPLSAADLAYTTAEAEGIDHLAEVDTH